MTDAISPLLANQEFRELESSWQRARAAHVPRESFYVLAGKAVRLCIAGQALAAYLQRAFAHVAIAHVPNPALTIELWDEAETGVPYPFTFAPNAPELPQLSDGEVLRADSSARFIRTEKSDAVTWLDRKTSRILGWRANGAIPPTHERSKPLSFLISLWLYDQDVVVLHAGMVARNGNGVLISGGSGIGKTTTALTCLLAGFDYLGDDQIAVETHDGKMFCAHSLFHSARLEPNHLTRFPAFEPHTLPSTDPLDNKSLVFIGELYPEQIKRTARVCALVLPRLAGGKETHLEPASRTQALTYLARTSLMSPFGIGRRRFERITQLLGSIPCYWLELGHDLATIPPVIDELIPGH